MDATSYFTCINVPGDRSAQELEGATKRGPVRGGYSGLLGRGKMADRRRVAGGEGRLLRVRNMNG